MVSLALLLLQELRGLLWFLPFLETIIKNQKGRESHAL
jgi:hypothetical protein